MLLLLPCLVFADDALANNVVVVSLVPKEDDEY